MLVACINIESLIVRLMADSDMLDDIKALLDGDFGDDRILKEIYQACRNREVISNYERRYVRDLVERYLKKDAMQGAAPVGDGPAEASPDVLLPGMQSGRDDLGAARRDVVHAEPAAASNADDGHVKLISSKTKRSGRSSRTAMIAVVVGLVVVAVAASVALSMAPSDDAPSVPTSGVSDPASPRATGFSIRTDLGSYSEGDFIQVAGTSDVHGWPITISVVNPAGSVVWTESVHARDGGTYSTIIISGGGGVWDGPGTFTITAVRGDGAVTSSEFVIVS